MKRPALAGLLLAGLATAQAPTVQRFDPAQSQASFTVLIRMMAAQRGSFGTVDGELEPAPDGQWRVRVRLDARSLHFDGPDWLERSTRSAKFLDVQKHPEIAFVSEPFAPALLRDGGELRGRLALRGQRRAVAFVLAPSGCERPGQDCDIHVSGSIDRRSFGMRAYRLLLRDEVGFDFRVRLQAAP